MRKIVPKAEIVVTIDEDGSILEPPIAELYALCLADGVEPEKAWKNAGGADSERQRQLRAALDENPGFQARIKALEIDRSRALVDEVYGQAIWMINQAFRECRAKRDRTGMLQCTQMRLDAAKGVARLAERERNSAKPGDNGTQPARPVGRPSEESPQSGRNMDEIRRALVEKGVTLAAREDEDEAA